MSTQLPHEYATIRIHKDLVERIDRIASRLTERAGGDGVSISRSHVIKRALDLLVEQDADLAAAPEEES